MSSVPTDFGGLAGSGGSTADAYTDIQKPDDATLSGEYMKNTDGITKPILPRYRTPRVEQII
jgi:hypothetical protein